MRQTDSKIDLNNPEFQQAYRLLKDTNANVFLTGRAGTGKSTFLRFICRNIDKKYVILAPTGVAAVNVGGVTIHSFFQMPLRPVPPDDPDYSVASFKNPKKYNRNKRKLLKEIELIIIDEVSMVRPDMIDFIDRVLRGVTGKRGLPFGGVQLLLVGDIFQLEPVVNPDTRLILSKYYSDFFFFNALAYKSVNLVSVELKKIYRQNDPNFIGVLDRVRKNQVTWDDLNLLNKNVNREEKEMDDKFGITLTTRRDIASSINKEKMESLPGEEYIFKGEIRDDFPEKLLPTDLNLVLKRDAQVMLIRNDKDRRWVNGTLARITDISQTSITIKLENGEEVKLEREEWSNITYSYNEKEKKVQEEILGQFVQYPLRAAWALTIHKSQGLTFNNVAIDMGSGAFSAGQTYVALSRCRTLEGIHFLNPIRRGDVIVSQGANNFSKNFNDKSQSEKVFREARAKVLSEQAISQFENDEFAEAVESVWSINELTGALSQKMVRRLLASRLSVLKRLKEELRKKSSILKDISEDYYKMGGREKKSGSISEALRLFRKAVEIDENNLNARFCLAELLLESGEDKEGLRILKDVEKGDKKTAYASLMLRGRHYARTGDSSRAALTFIAASKKAPAESEPIKELIELYEKEGLEEEAEKYKGWLKEKFS
ncbi:MAG: AAA family ATPase [Muribaculaceae bacterium]|nr:AAA family ATPase [Muribaculaceae bacterium]